MSSGAVLLRDGKYHKCLDVLSMMTRAAEKPRIDTTLKNVKSTCHQTPNGSGVGSVILILGILVRREASQMGQRPGNGASLHGSPGPLM
jgi:hypothetical protein